MSSLPSQAPLDLSMEALRKKHPKQYRGWVRIGLVAAVLGYAASVGALTVEHGAEVLLHTDPYTLLTQLIALVAFFRGRERLAAAIAMSAVWADLQVSFLLHGVADLAASLTLAPLVMGVGLLLGGRAAFLTAAASAVVVPVTTLAGQLLGLHEGFTAPGALHIVVGAEAVIIATAALVITFQRSLAVSQREQHNAERRARTLQVQLERSQRMEALGLLAGGIAHDFNNLLTAVSAYGTLLSSSTDPEARELGPEISAVQERGATLVRQLLAFARQDMVQPRPIDAAEVLAGTATLIHRLLGERYSLSLTFNQVCPIIADPGQIEQILLNLAANAKDAMPNGGKVEIGCELRGDEVILSVSDTGVGMDEETRTRAFEPFFTTKERGKGTGLGLSTVHGIVAAAGGWVDIESEPGVGTRFELHLPRTDQPLEEAPVSRRRGAADTGSGRTIIMVEDNDGVRAVVQRVLAQANYEVHVANNGEEALKLIDGLHAVPSLVLTDVVMPGMTGPELVTKVHERWPNMPYLYMSGYLGDIADSFDFDPSVDLIAKPFSPAALLDRINTRIEQAA